MLIDIILVVFYLIMYKGDGQPTAREVHADEDLLGPGELLKWIFKYNQKPVSLMSLLPLEM